MFSATSRCTMARPVPPVAPATNARRSENADDDDVSLGETIGTTSPSAGVRSSAGENSGHQKSANATQRGTHHCSENAGQYFWIVCSGSENNQRVYGRACWPLSGGTSAPSTRSAEDRQRVRHGDRGGPLDRKIRLRLEYFM